MPERILVPVDGSPFSEEILPYAIGLARKTGAELALLRVVSGETRRAAAQREVDALADEVGAQARTVLIADDPAGAILVEAGRRSGTLVAMGSRGRGGLLEATLGSVAKAVVRASIEPVLLYRPRGAATRDRRQPIEISTVLLPIDGQPESEAMAPHAAALAKVLDADLEVVQVILPGTQHVRRVPGREHRESAFVESRAEDIQAKHGARTRWTLLRGEPVGALTRHVGNRRDVVLAMATRGRRPLQELVLGSVTGGCLREAGVPILTRRP